MHADAGSDACKRSSSFRSLAELLLPIAVVRDAVHAESLSIVPRELQVSCREIAEMPMESVTAESREIVGTITGQLEPSPEAVLHDIETFRAYAIETIERSLERLLMSMAEEVLGRELILAPADVSEIVRRALRRYDREGPIRVRVSAADLGNVQTDLPVVVDNDLKAGDLLVEVRDGMLDARMDVRLDCVVRRFAGTAVTPNTTGNAS